MSEAPKELYFYDDWLAQHTEGKMLCGNNRYLHENHVDALLKAEREKALREAMDMVSARIVQAASGGENLLSPNAIWTGIEALLLLHAPGAGQPRDSRPAP